MYSQKLEKIGLSPKEATIYTKLLEAGDSTAGILSKITKIKRPTVYLILRELESRGLVLEIAGKKKLFRAENPEKLKKITKRRRRKLIADELELEQLIPALLNISKSQVLEPLVKIFHDIEGIKNILEDISSSRKPWYFFGSSENIIKAFPLEDLNELIEVTDDQREKAGRPKVLFITDKGIKTLKHFKAHKPGIREIKTLPNIQEKSALIIYEEKILIFNGSENIFAILIDSKEISSMVKVMFKMLWESIKN